MVIVNKPKHRLIHAAANLISRLVPTDKSVGYFHLVRVRGR